MRCLALAAGLSVMATGALACHDFHAPLTLEPSDTAAVAAYLQTGEIPVSRPFDAKIRLCHDDDTPPVSVEFDAHMPAHMHGMNYEPRVQAAEGGVFDVSNIVFHMPGLWRVTVTVDDGQTTHAYSADVVVE